MQFGICTGLSGAAEAAKLGFDYLELPVSGIAALSDDAFEAQKKALLALGLPCPCFNLLFPGDMALLDPALDFAVMENYLHGAFARLRALGGALVVFGSGRSRMRPDGMSYGEAFRRLAEVTRRVGEVARQYGLVIAIEPLNRSETNMICSLAEGAALAAAANHSQVTLLADYYHVVRENEPLSDIVRLLGVTHTHIASKEGRRFPLSTAGDQYEAFFANLHTSGYTGRMSIEGGTDDLAADAATALALLKKLHSENQ